MAVFETLLKSDLKKPVTVQALQGVVFTADSAGNRVTVEVTDGGSPAALSGTVTGYVIRADGGTLAVTGTLSGNKASIVLPASAYAVPGPMQIAIRLTAGSVKTVLGACSGYVQRSTTDTVIDPGHVIPSLEELLAQIAVMEQATADAEAATSAANTAASNANTKATAANTAASNANTKAAAADTAAAAANQAAQNANQAAQGIQQYNNRITILETGKVAKVGDRMTGNLTFSNRNNAAGSVQFENPSGTVVGGLFQFTDSGRICISQTTPDASTPYGKGERYLMPVPSDHDAVTYYSVLTTKNTVAVPQGGTGATTPAGACENLGAVKKTGDTVTGPLIFSNGNNYLGINFKGANGAPTVGFKNTGTRMTLDQYADESVGGERFLMPVPEVRSADIWYSILTSKNAVTVAQGGTGAANAKTARENLGLKTEAMTLTYTSGVAHQTGTSGIVCGHLVQINECVKLSADKAAGATWFSIPYTSAKWAYGTVQDASGFVATCHLANGNVIVDQAVKASEHQYPQIIITSRIDD